MTQAARENCFDARRPVGPSQSKTRLVNSADWQVRGLYHDRSCGLHQDACRECPEIRQSERDRSIGKTLEIDDPLADG
jgi:hypothetical protein